MTRDPLTIPTAHIVSLLTARARPTESPGHWPTVEAMEQGRARRRLFWDAVLGAIVLVGVIAIWYGAMACWAA